MSGIRKDAVLPDDEPEKPVAARDGADPGPRRGIDARGDEALDDAVGVDDAEGRVPGSRRGAGPGRR